MGRQNPLRLRIAAANIQDGAVTVRGAELHHLRVRRLGRGDALVCFDESGAEHIGTIRRISATAAEIELGAGVKAGRESPLQLTLAQAALKGDHLDLVVEKATELGVHAIVLFECERTVARPSAAKIERLRRIAESAAKQSGRVRIPEIRGLVRVDDVLSAGALLFHPEAERVAARELGDFDAVTAIVGPEGGFTPAEIAAAARAGCISASLGPRTLRAETAGIVACALCQHLWGDS